MLLAGLVSNVTIRNAELLNVSLPIHVYQTNGAHPYVTCVSA